MNITETLEKVGKDVHRRWPNINNGGCCVFASIVGTELKNMGIPVKGIVSSHSSGNISLAAVRRRLERHANIWQWSDNCVWFNHVGLEFKLDGEKYHYDTSGVWKPNRYLDGMPLYRGHMRIEELRVLSLSDDGWNPRFNRQHIPKIEQYVKRALRPKSVDRVPKWFNNLFINEE